MIKTPVLHKISDFILNLLMPPQCVGCQASSSYFCTDCQKTLYYIPSPICNKCGSPYDKGKSDCQQCQRFTLTYLDSACSVAFFKGGPLRSAIHKFKYQNYQVLGKSFAHLLATYYTNSKLETEVIVPVPLHKSRYKERGYNQSTLMGKELSKLLGLSFDDKTLIRHQATKSQMTLNANERKTNVINAFKCHSDKLANKSILLIDDVYTTGATLDACAYALKQIDVKAVYGLTLARA